MYCGSQLLNRVLKPGGGLVVDQGNDLVVFLAQFLRKYVWGNRLVPFGFQQIGLFAVGQGYLVPAIAKCAVDARQHAFFG